MHKELEQNKVYNTIIENLDNNSTIQEALFLANSFYRYVFTCICSNFEGIEEDQIDAKINELDEFTNYPYCTIVNNTKMMETKELKMIIKDRYKLLNINIENEDLELNNIDSVIDSITKIVQGHYIRENNINLEEILCALEFKKILDI